MSPLGWKIFKIIWLPHVAQEETENQVGGWVTCQRVHRPQETLRRWGRGGSRGPWRPGEVMTVTIPPGGSGGEAQGSCRRVRSQGWLRLIASCMHQPLLSLHLSPHHTGTSSKTGTASSI